MPSRIISIFSSGDYETQIGRGAQTLREGGLVVLPTETAYGTAAVLNHPDARRRLIEFRGESRRPFTVHLAAPADAAAYLGDVGDYGRRLMRKLWPGPVCARF